MGADMDAAGADTGAICGAPEDMGVDMDAAGADEDVFASFHAAVRAPMMSGDAFRVDEGRGANMDAAGVVDGEIFCFLDAAGAGDPGDAFGVDVGFTP